MTKNKSMIWILFYGFLFLIGCGLFYGAYTNFQKTKSLLAKGETTTATVVSFSTSQGKNGAMYKPNFEFTDKFLNKRSFESGIASSPPAYDLGEKVKIIYDPKSDKEVKTISFWGLYRGSVILGMIAAPFLIIGGSYLLYALY